MKSAKERDGGGSRKLSDCLTPVYALAHGPVVYAREEMRIDPKRPGRRSRRARAAGSAPRGAGENGDESEEALE
jgi:hypothetical protein